MEAKPGGHQRKDGLPGCPAVTVRELNPQGRILFTYQVSDAKNTESWIQKPCARSFYDGEAGAVPPH